MEAKVQNYDGDDWGAPESDEEPDSPPPGPPQVMTARPAVDRRLPSESRVPGSGRASPVVGPPNSTRTWESSSRVPSLSTSDSRRRPVSDNTDPIKTDPALPAQELDSTPVVGTEGGISEQQQDEVRASRRTSKSPQLPDVARMSGFGPDLFFSNSGAQDKPASQPTVQEESPQQSPQPSSALPATGQDTTESRGQLTPAADPRNLPALRTPSPHEPRTVPPPVEEPKNESPAPDSWQAPNPDVTPTEPLQPKKPERSPSDYEPGPLQRQPTLETATSSPVKESDVLSQEIMRSLSPGGGLTPIDTSVGAKAPQGPSPATRRESSYTLSGYDDYWADSGESPRLQKRPTGDLDNVPEDAPPSSTGPSNGPSAVPAIVESTVVPKSSGQEPIRRKFSWEDLGDDTQSAKSPARSATASPAVTAAQPNDALPAEQPALMSPSINIIPENDSLVGQQVDQRDFSPQPLAIQEPTPEPASPLSDSGDRGALFAGAVSPMTQASASSMHQGDAAADFSIAAEDEKKIPSFREIMFLQTPAERIAKYNEARDAFGQMESGLNNWILTMKQELPEHAHTTASYSGDTLPPNPAATGGLDGAGQQSYYQQGPNAQGGSARSRLPGFPMQAHGHAGGQIGTKGKEFMQSAGKMGKGLFSKGRNKLRGDKVFH